MMKKEILCLLIILLATACKEFAIEKSIPEHKTAQIEKKYQSKKN